MSAHNQFDPLMRQLEQELEEENPFDRLLEQEEELESKAFQPVRNRPPSAKGNAQVRWLQRALNRVSAFGITENGVLSVPTRRALQKFQADQGLRPTGKLGPKTRAALIRLSGISAPNVVPREDDDETLYEAEGFVGSCPDSPYIIRGFGKYDNFIPQLPPEQQKKLELIAAEIAASQAGTAGITPITQVIVVGHADLDPGIESRNPGFLQFISEKRAHAVLEDLNCRFVTLTSGSHTPATLSGRDWIGAGRGARALAIASPRNESERQCNRRAEVILVRTPRLPKLTQPPSTDLLTDSDLMLELYHVALQGTSGQYEHAQTALQKAKEIAEKSVRIIKFKLRDRTTRCPAFPDLQGFTSYFKDALQGTASKYSDTTVVVDRATEIAEQAGFNFELANHKLEWKYAVLPQPMAPDCEIIRGQVPGPANHALCGPHGHILDTTAKVVIAHDLDEYKKQFRR